jgi:hypothetical protein
VRRCGGRQLQGPPLLVWGPLNLLPPLLPSPLVLTPARPPARLAECLTKAATIIQRHARGHLARLHFRQSREAVLCLQAGVRGMLARRRAREMRRQQAALAIQTAFRRHKLRQEYKASYAMVVATQAMWRGVQARTAYDRMRNERAATTLQSNWRRWVAASDFNRQRAAATTLQNAWRCARGLGDAGGWQGGRVRRLGSLALEV